METCVVCKKECPCSCFEEDFDEYGTAYFCSEECIKEFEKKYSCDIELEHNIDCKIYGNFEEKWVKNLQKMCLIFEQSYYEFHAKWRETKEKLEEFQKGARK